MRLHRLTAALVSTSTDALTVTSSGHIRGSSSGAAVPSLLQRASDSMTNLFLSADANASAGPAEPAEPAEPGLLQRAGNSLTNLFSPREPAAPPAPPPVPPPAPPPPVPPPVPPPEPPPEPAAAPLPNAPPAPPPPPPLLPPAPPPAAAAGSDGDSPELALFRKMLQLRVPRAAVEAKMRAQGLDPALLFGAAEKASAALVAPPVAPPKKTFKNMPCEPTFAANLGWLNGAFETADLERSGTRRDPYGMAMEAMDGVARKKALRPPKTVAEIVLERAAAEQLWIESMERDMEAGVAANIPLPDLEMEARNDVRMWGTKGFPEGKAWYEFNSVEAQNYMLRREKIFQRHADLERTSKLPDLEQAHKVEAVERALEAVEEQMDVLQEEA